MPTSHKKRKSVPLTLWVPPAIKAELERIAKTEQLTISKTGGALLTDAIRQKLHKQHAVLLDAIIDKAIGRHMKAYSSRLALLLVRNNFVGEQTRGIVASILLNLPGMTEPTAKDIRDKSSDTAKRNITRRTPQLENIVKEVEQWLEEVTPES